MYDCPAHNLFPCRASIGTRGCVKSRSNRRDRPTRTTILTVDKKETTDTIPRECRTGRAAHLTRHVFRNVLSQQTLDVLGNVSSTKDETLISINRCFGPEFGQRKLQHVLGITMHEFANFLKVHPESLFRTHTHELRWFHRMTFTIREFGIIRL